MTLQCYLIFIYYMKVSFHRLVVGNAFGVVALHYTHYHIGQRHPFFLHHFVVFYNVELHLRCHQSNSVYLVLLDRKSVV